MRIVAILTILLAVAVPARAQWKTVEPVEIKGAYGLIIVHGELEREPLHLRARLLGRSAPDHTVPG
jgi:hypothetical protein